MIVSMRFRGGENDSHLAICGVNTLLSQSLATRFLPAHILVPRSSLRVNSLGSLWLPLCPVVGTFGARVADGREKVVSVVVAGDLWTCGVDGGEHEGVELCISALDAVLCDGEVWGGEEVEEGEVGHACAEEVDVVVDGHGDAEMDESSGDEEEEGGGKMHTGVSGGVYVDDFHKSRRARNYRCRRRNLAYLIVFSDQSDLKCPSNRIDRDYKWC